MYKILAVLCFYMFMLCNFELLTEILNIMCIFFSVQMKWENLIKKKSAGFLLVSLFGC